MIKPNYVRDPLKLLELEFSQNFVAIIAKPTPETDPLKASISTFAKQIKD